MYLSKYRCSGLELSPHFPFFLTNLNGREMLNSREVTELEYRTSKNIIYVDTFYVVPIQNEKGISSYEIFFKNFFSVSGGISR